MNKLLSGLLLFSIGIIGQSVAQVNSQKYQLIADRLTSPITLDGKLDEPHWQNADRTDNFILTFPVDSVSATSQTVTMVAFDDRYLYIAGICYENSDKEHVMQSLRRDFSWSRNENLSVYIDPYDDYTNGFTFGITPFGVRREGLVTNGGEVSDDWDNKWFSEVTDFGDRWEFEMKIPFKTVRYDEENREWNIIFLRKDLKNNEESNWAPVPQGYRPSSFAFSGRLIFSEPLKKAGPNIAFIPYVSAATSEDFEEDISDREVNAGFDAKIGVSSSLNLDLTVNPDFSQVEVDQQVTNLSRFEIFFPERRQFFLENQDLFGESGFRQSRPFFSRRIGIGEDTAGNKLQIPILYGARLSGKIGKDWRIGLLNMQTKSKDGARLTGVSEVDSSYNLLAQNYTVGVIQRRVFGRSNVGVIMVNRQALDYERNEEVSTTTKYNRVVGVDYNLLSLDGRWEGDFFYHRSIDEESKDDAFSTGMFLGYNTTNLELRVIASALGEGFNAETGFIQRRDIIRLGTFNDLNLYPENSSFLVRHGPGIDFNYRTDMEFNKTDMDFGVDYDFTHQNTSNFSIGWSYDYQKLRRNFDPSGTDVPDSLRLQSGEDFEWTTVGASYETDARKVLSGEFDMSYGGFYNGKRYNATAQINFRYQPYGLVAMTIDYNNLHGFPAPFEDTEFWLIGPRIDLTFTDQLFLTTFVQYNEQADNVNLNARFQWRYKPVSDLFVVYTDNYFPGNFKTKSRAIVFKLTYWLNF
ncbi:hypothetical protein E1176_06680 [Fulvivirga sp. RKSG066]|uniref:carbohydrate binding family 9 domain-containing protein n=1 Tax=Fulvivirga aurantia TaxID=2529383 RepID=UPI0012BC6CC7|nr:DUF5916 domain-containing protein [Fulvivirga aurantia]MTI20700.1 hypothetical protein [Fulvivirga aurantia]